MELPRDAVEYATVTFTDYPSGVSTTQASFDRSTWFPFDLAPTAQTDGTWVGKVLLRGPDASGTNGHLVTANTTMWVRVVDSPEIVPVQAGGIYLI